MNDPNPTQTHPLLIFQHSGTENPINTVPLASGLLGADRPKNRLMVVEPDSKQPTCKPMQMLAESARLKWVSIEQAHPLAGS